MRKLLLIFAPLLFVLPLPAQDTMLGIPEPPARQWLMLIGVDHYQDQEFLTDLTCSRSSLLTLANFLWEGFGYTQERTRILFNERATRSAIEKEMRRLISRVHPEDSVLIIFAGNGDMDYVDNTSYWYGYDAHSISDGIPDFLVRHWCRSLQARHVLLLADAHFPRSPLGQGQYFGQTENLDKKSREFLVSGMARPYPAQAGGVGGGMSIFLGWVYKVLESFTERNVRFSVHDLHQQLQLAYRHSRLPEPRLGVMPGTYHEGGRFFFYPRPAQGVGRARMPEIARYRLLYPLEKNAPHSHKDGAPPLSENWETRLWERKLRPFFEQAPLMLPKSPEPSPEEAFLAKLKAPGEPDQGNPERFVSDSSRFLKEPSGIIWDKKTNLEWVVGPNQDVYWKQAKRWVEGLEIGGGGWRLPSAAELKTLYVPGKGHRNMDPLFRTSGWWVWSGDTQDGQTAWFHTFRFNDGYWGSKLARDRIRVFAVREKR